MKKRVILGSIAAIAVMTVAGWNISQSKSDAILSDVALDRVEALAQEITCSGSSGGQCFRSDYNCGGSWCGCYFSGYQSDFCYYG